MVSPGADLRVLKFGGAALRDGPGVGRACRIVAELGGERPIVVVSAHLGVTGLLDRAARDAAAGLVRGDDLRIRHRSLLHQLQLDSELLDRHLRELFGLLRQVSRRGALGPELRDHVLSFGERMSARVVAAALRRSGVAATPVDAYDVGLLTDSNHGRARPLQEATQRLRRALERVPGVPVVTGFLAADGRGNLTTLGPNGSDLTAALLAEAVAAPEVHLWKTVDGVMTADPELVPDARPIERLGYSEAAELAWHGATVVHPAAALTARRAGFAVRVRNANRPESPGTLIVREAESDGPVGIARREDVVHVRLRFAPAASGTRPDGFAALSRLLAEQELVPLALSTGSGDAELVIERGAGLGADAEDALASRLGALGVEVEVDRDVGLVAVVGRGVGDTRFEAAGSAALERGGLRPLLVAGREQGLSRLLLFRREDVGDAVRALHASFFPSR